MNATVQDEEQYVKTVLAGCASVVLMQEVDSLAIALAIKTKELENISLSHPSLNPSPDTRLAHHF